MRTVSKKGMIALVGTAILAGMVTVPVSAKTVLNMMTHTHKPFNDWIKSKIVEYGRIRPDVEIKYTYVEHVQFDPKLLTMVAAGMAPDIVNLYSPTFVDFIRSKFMDTPPPPIQDDMKRNFLPWALTGMKVDGTIWGYPTEAIVLLPVANRNVFSKAGMPMPDSYDQMVEATRKLKTKDSSGKVTQVGATFPGDGPWLLKAWSSFMWGYGGDLIDTKTNKAVMASPEGIRATVNYKEMLATAPSGGFEKDKVGLIVNGPYARPVWKKQKLNTDNYVALKAPKGVDGERVNNMYYWGMMVTRMSKRKKEAWEFVKWLNNPQNKLDLTKDVEYPPLTKYERDHFKEDSWMSTFSDEMENGRLLPHVNRWNAIEQSLVTRLQAFANGKVPSPEQTLRYCDQDTNSYLTRFGTKK